MTGVVNTAEIAYKPAIVIPGVEVRYCYVNEHGQTLNTFIPDYYTYQCEIPEIDSTMFLY